MIDWFEPRPRWAHEEASLTFAPLAWLKLQYFCHAGPTEVAGFGITAKDDFLYVKDFATVRQHASAMTVVMEDAAVADFSDRCVDAGLSPQRYMRVWCHTHPGLSPEPSGVDEDTFERVFGSCDWAVMVIVSRTSQTYARLSFHVGPGGATQLPVTVDWAAWPVTVKDLKGLPANLLAAWQAEFAANVQPIREVLSSPIIPVAPTGGPDPLWDNVDEYDQQHWEEFESD